MKALPQFTRIYVEITDHCNLACSFCPIDSTANTFMSPSQFRHIAKQLTPYTKQVALHILGEPLSHPQLDEIFDICQDNSLQVFLVTNGLLLKKYRHLLQHPALEQLHISLQSFADNFADKDPVVYLKGLHETIEFGLLNNLKLEVSLRLWDLKNDVSVAINSDFRNHLAHVFDFKWDGVFIDVRRKKRHYLKDRLDLYFDSRFTWPTVEQPSKFQQGRCHALTHHLGIRVDGTVVPCCLDSQGAIPLGNIFNHDFEIALKNPRARAMQRGFQRRELIEPLCQNCDFAQRFGH